jgi:hypothetical protein
VVRAGEGEAEGALGLTGRLFAGDGVLLGIVAPVLDRGRSAR